MENTQRNAHQPQQAQHGYNHANQAWIRANQGRQSAQSGNSFTHPSTPFAAGQPQSGLNAAHYPAEAHQHSYSPYYTGYGYNPFYAGQAYSPYHAAGTWYPTFADAYPAYAPYSPMTAYEQAAALFAQQQYGFQGQLPSSNWTPYNGYQGQAFAGSWSPFAGFQGQTPASNWAPFSGYQGQAFASSWSPFAGFQGQTPASNWAPYNGYQGQAFAGSWSPFAGFQGQTPASNWAPFSGYQGQAFAGNGLPYAGFQGQAPYSNWAPYNGYSAFSGFQGQAPASYFAPQPFGFQNQTGNWSPVVNVLETNDAYFVNAEVCGVREEDVEIYVQHNILTIRGQKQLPASEQQHPVQSAERVYGPFTRTVVLATPVQAAKVKAQLQFGVLEIECPKISQQENGIQRIKIAKK